MTASARPQERELMRRGGIQRDTLHKITTHSEPPG